MSKLVGYYYPGAPYGQAPAAPPQNARAGLRAFAALGIMIAVMVGASMVQSKRQTGKWLELR